MKSVKMVEKAVIFVWFIPKNEKTFAPSLQKVLTISSLDKCLT